MPVVRVEPRSRGSFGWTSPVGEGKGKKRRKYTARSVCVCVPPCAAARGTCASILPRTLLCLLLGFNSSLSLPPQQLFFFFFLSLPHSLSCSYTLVQYSLLLLSVASVSLLDDVTCYGFPFLDVYE